MSGLLEPYDGPTGRTSGSTERSQLAEKVIHAFVRSGNRAAKVRWELTPFGIDEMYKGLWNCTQKHPYAGRVRVARRAGELILERIAK